jgi:hypothetical protein
MRLVIVGLALGLAVPAVAGVPGLSMVAAQSPVSTQPLAPGEVLLEVDALGTVTTRADTATLLVRVEASAATETEARRATESAADRIVAAASSAGVAASDISRHPITRGENEMLMAMQDMQRSRRPPAGDARSGRQRSTRGGERSWRSRNQGSRPRPRRASAARARGGGR